MISSYLNILAESLQKKMSVLEEIEAENRKQEELLKAETFSYDGFDAAIDTKGELIEKLTALDDGFESLYEKIRKELLDNRTEYAVQIKKLQELVARVTDKSVKVQAQEARNKQLVESVFAREKDKIRSGRKNSKAAYDYYRNMSKGNVTMPQFMDKKK